MKKIIQEEKVDTQLIDLIAELDLDTKQKEKFKNYLENHSLLLQQIQDLQSKLKDIISLDESEFLNSPFVGLIINNDSIIEKVNSKFIQEFSSLGSGVVGKKLSDIFLTTKELNFKKIDNYEITSNKRIILTEKLNYAQHEFIQIPTRNSNGIVISKLLHLQTNIPSEKILREFINKSLQGIIILQEGSISYSNKIIADYFGFTSEEILNLSREKVFELVHPEDKQYFILKLKQKLASIDLKEPFRIRARKKDDTYKWVELYASIITYNNKKGLQLLVLDIDDEKRLELQIKDFEKKFREESLRNNKAEIPEDIDDKNINKKYERINEFLLTLSLNPEENINSIAQLCGEIFNGTIACYNRIENDKIYTIGKWKLPPDVKLVDSAFGHICFEVVNKKSSNVFILNDLEKTKFYKSDKNVKKFNLQSYISAPVSLYGKNIGSLCVMFNYEFKSSGKEIDLLKVLANSVSLEEKRLAVSKELRLYENQLESVVKKRSSEIQTKNMLLEKEIKEREKIQEKLSESRETYKTLVENLPVEIFYKNSKSVIVSCNERFAKTFNMVPSQIEGMNDFDLYPSENAAQYSNEDKTILAKGLTLRVEEEGVRNNVRFVSKTVKAPVRNSSGETIGVIGFIWDITQEKKVLESLYESEQKFKSLFNHSSDAIFLFDCDGTIKDVNLKASELFGIDVKDIINKKIQYLEIYSDDKKIDVKKIFSSNEVVTINAKIHNRKENTSWVEISFSLIELEGIRYSLAIARDFTLRNSIIEKEKRHLKNLEIISSASMEILKINTAAGLFKMFGSRINQIVKDSFVLIFTKELNKIKFEFCCSDNLFEDKLRMICGKTIEELGVNSNSLNINLIPGKYTLSKTDLKVHDLFSSKKITKNNIESLISVFKDQNIFKGEFQIEESSEVLMYIGTANDLSENQFETIDVLTNSFLIGYQRLKTDKLLQKSEALYRGIIEDQTEFIVRFNSEYNFLFINEFYKKYINLSQQKLLSSKFIDFVYKSDIADVKKNLSRITTDNPTISVSHRYEDGIKDLKWIDWICRGIFSLSGKLLEVQAVGRDITQKLKSERELKELLIDLKKTSNAKNDFLANMSHELRTPLNGILGFAQLLKNNKSFPSKYHKEISVIENSGNHLLNLINDILDVSKIESNTMQIKNDEFNLIECINNISKVIEIKAIKKNLSFKRSFDKKLPKIVIGDEKRLQQILLNLLDNAIKFTPKGSVFFKVDCVRSKCRFVIQDTGLGIQDDQLDEIFSPFNQGKISGVNYYGAGLGLSISKKLIQLNDSRLYIKSKTEIGTSLWFTIALPEIFPSLNPKEISKIVGYNGKRKKILIVDDNPENRFMLNHMLGYLGFEISEASSGLDCLSKIKDSVPDLVLLDILMPVMDGLETAQEIRNKFYKEEIKIIAFSASTFNNTKFKSIQAGCDEFLARPIKIKSILRIIQNLLNINWIFEDDLQSNGRAPNSTINKMVPPDLEYCRKILNAAEKGDIKKIVSLNSKLYRSDNKYKVFTNKVRSLIEDFEIDDIQHFIEELINENT